MTERRRPKSVERIVKSAEIHNKTPTHQQDTPSDRKPNKIPPQIPPTIYTRSPYIFYATSYTKYITLLVDDGYSTLVILYAVTLIPFALYNRKQQQTEDIIFHIYCAVLLYTDMRVMSVSVA